MIGLEILTWVGLITKIFVAIIGIISLNKIPILGSMRAGENELDGITVLVVIDYLEFS